MDKTIIRKAAEIALQSIQEAYILVDEGKCFVTANESACKIFPNLKALDKGADINRLEGFPEELLSGESGDFSLEFETAGDFHYYARVSPVLSEKDKVLGYIILIRDITESVLIAKRLEEISYTDALTGVMNRRHFMDLADAQIDRVKRQKSGGFIVIFDIDHFKEVNDEHGHLVGDKVLKEIADRINRTIRQYDVFGRYGGEEFVLFVTDISESDMREHAERMRLAICSEPMDFDEAEVTVSVSLGVASVNSAGSIYGILRKADDALFKAKEGGRNMVVFDE
jgi:diguanylate cyclase (GGDEF)-like protein